MMERGLKLPSHTNFIDMTGRVCGLLTVVEYAGKDARSDVVCWRCRCVCGTERVVPGSRLRNGTVTSCGCSRPRRGVHGYGNHPLYQTWAGMIARCYSKKIGGYKNYGGRGITVCSRWRNSPEAFISDMGDKPTPRPSIDRIKNDGNYEPGNCRWATSLEQNLNKRVSRSNTSGVVGVHWCKRRRRWLASIKIGGKRKHLGEFADLAEAAAVRGLAEEARSVEVADQRRRREAGVAVRERWSDYL